jgi:lysophospholipase L1-like esterase
VPAHADLITVTAGGNDLDFPGSMLFAAWAHFEPDGPLTRMLSQGFVDGIPAPTSDRVEATAAGLTRIAQGSMARAPGARVVLVDYLTVIPDEIATTHSLPFTAEQLVGFSAIQRALAAAYRFAAERSGAQLLSMSTISRQHGLGSGVPCVSDFLPTLEKTAGSFHPNRAGMRAVADALVAALAD